MEVHGELNRPDGAGLPKSDYCIANCIEMAVLGDRSAVLARDMNGTPFVAVSTTREGFVVGGTSGVSGSVDDKIAYSRGHSFPSSRG